MKFTKNASIFKKSRFFTMLALILAVCMLLSTCLIACNKNPYANDNSFEVEVIEDENALTFAPKDFNYTYGVILYVGAFVSPSEYTYLAEALATQGYLTVIPKFPLNMSAANYTKEEPAFSAYPNVKFFIAGHDQGGGAAIRRAQDSGSKVAGVLLYSPMIINRRVYDYEQDRFVEDENGNPVYEPNSIAERSLPTLWIESDDVTRTEDIRNKVKENVNMSTVTEYELANSTARGFSTNAANLTNEEKAQRQAQLDLTVQYTLRFLKRIVCKR
ncbi:MAG: alpha/beta hydrolase [Clostridia bacterium]|nr:alpha/beta hydrolase [Clostridia bacterium]